VIHDLYLRAHIVESHNNAQRSERPERSSQGRSVDAWPQYALVWDTETTLDLEQTLNFGVWRYCQLQGTQYVAVQEGIFYRDGLDDEGIEIIRNYARRYHADGMLKAASNDLEVLTRRGVCREDFLGVSARWCANRRF
jgi:hypothetical protein